jgi:trk system potassium uptake protein TrkA
MKFCVIGLGRFGYQVATILAENGMEVLAVDSNEEIVNSISDLVTQAVCVHVTSEETLRSIGVDEIETVIVAIGELFSESILITALLKKRLGIKTVITRAITDIHKEILTLVGADRVILPEKEIGIRLADNLSSPFTDLIRLSKEFVISNIIPPARFIGKTIAELDLFNRHQVHCIGLKEREAIITAAPEYVIKEGDRLVVAGTREQVAHMIKN